MRIGRCSSHRTHNLSIKVREVGNQPWVRYVHYAEKASKFARTVARSGGPVGAFAGGVVGATAGDYAKDRIKSNLKRIQTHDA